MSANDASGNSDRMWRNWEEHDRIWKSIETLRDSQLSVNTQVSSLVSAIRDLIDRIPPENLR